MATRVKAISLMASIMQNMYSFMHTCSWGGLGNLGNLIFGEQKIAFTSNVVSHFVLRSLLIPK